MLAMPITLAAVVFDLNKFKFDLSLILGILAKFYSWNNSNKILVKLFEKGKL